MKLKILVVTNLYPPQVLGGYERSIADYANLFQKRGHDVLVLTSDTPDFSTQGCESHWDSNVHRCLQLAGRWYLGRPPEWYPLEETEAINRRNIARLAYYLKLFQPDVCLIGNLDFLPVCLIDELLACHIPVVHYVMNETPGYMKEQAPSSRLYRCVTCSEWVKRRMEQKGYPTATTITVYPGAAVEFFYESVLPQQDRLRIAFASLVMAYKGADVLVDALLRLDSVGIDFVATIAGHTLDPEFLRTLKDSVEASGLSSRIRFPGVLSRQELKELYRTHNVLVFPSRFDEPFGISQIEGMMAGLTLITSGTGGAGEIVEHGFDGLCFESENAVQLADLLSILPANPEAWKAIAYNGQEKARLRFNQSQAVESLEAILVEQIQLRR